MALHAHGLYGSPSGSRTASNTRGGTMRPVRFLVSLLPLVVAAALALPTGASSAPAAAQLKLTPSFGPPTSRVRVSGRGFGASETVDVSFDTTPVATATTNPTRGVHRQDQGPRDRHSRDSHGHGDRTIQRPVRPGLVPCANRLADGGVRAG